jgi:hypothetical protein
MLLHSAKTDCLAPVLWEHPSRERGGSLTKLGTPVALFWRFSLISATFGFKALRRKFARPIQPAQSRFAAVKPGLGNLAQIYLQPVENQPITPMPLFSARFSIKVNKG